MPRRNSIPILLLTGFLGAGKTSLLNHLLGNDEGLKIGVIINDFGEVNIDSMLVAAQTDTALELSNGCICCSLEGENLDDALGQLAHQGSRLDYIVVEASGLAEPKELATMLRLLKNNYAHFDALVSVVDADNFEKNNRTNENAMGDLAVTDIVIINKVDLVDAAKLADIRKAIRLANPKARLLEASHGRVDFHLLLDLEEKPSAQLNLKGGHHHDGHDHEHDHEHLHDRFQTVSLSTQEPLDPAKFEAWAADLDPAVFRAKGIIFFGMKGVGQKFIFQAVGKRYSLKLDEWEMGQTPQTDLVVIGTGLDEEAAGKELEQLIDSSPDDISADTLMDILKYK